MTGSSRFLRISDRVVIRRTHLLPLALFAMLTGAISIGLHGSTGDEGPAKPRVPPSLAAVNIHNARLETVISGLNQPWAMEFTGPDSLLVTERPGRISRIDTRRRTSEEIEGVPPLVSSEVQTGLLDIEIHPDFNHNHRIYFSYTQADPETGRYYRLAVATAVLEGNRLREVRYLLPDIPYGWSPSNFGGALEFDDRGFLYISVGDHSEHQLSQDGGRLEGSILRLTAEGTVPDSNPFVGDETVDDRIYALGVRNPQGLHFDSGSGLLFEAEHGPLGGDEVNVIRAGKNYGWPTITYGASYSTASIGAGTHSEGLQQPLFYYLPSPAISPLTVYRGSMFSEWDGDILVGALKARFVSRLDRDGDLIRSEQRLLKHTRARTRDIKVAPDGSIFILSQSGSLYRLFRDGPSEPEPMDEISQARWIHTTVCSGCHENPDTDAPHTGVRAEWLEILDQPRELTDRHVLKGTGNMPARGLCNICTDEQLRFTTDYMLRQVQEAE